LHDLNQPIDVQEALAQGRRLSLLYYWRSFLEDEMVVSTIVGESEDVLPLLSTQTDEQLT
jgi:hypothetical protein